VAVVAVTKRYAASFAILAWAAVCAIAFRPPELRTGLHFRGGIAYAFPSKGCCGHLSLASVGWGRGSTHRTPFDVPGVYVSDETVGYGTKSIPVTSTPAPGLHLPTVVSGGIGALGYALGPRVDILDVNGLADPIAAHLKLMRRGYPGHEKRLPAPWAAAIVTASNTNPRADEFRWTPVTTTPPDPTLPFEQQVALARTALQCPAVHDLLRSTDSHLTIGLFFSNIVHSFSRTKLRIPSNPRDAVAQLCSRRATPVAQAPTLVTTRIRNEPALTPTTAGARANPYGPMTAAEPDSIERSAPFGTHETRRQARAPP